MFFAVELQTPGVYLLSQNQGLVQPFEPLIHTRKITTHDARGAAIVKTVLAIVGAAVLAFLLWLDHKGY